MLCVVFGLSDVLADENDNNRWTLYGVRISEYDEFLLSPPAEFIRNTLAIEVPKSKCSLSHRGRINSWMIDLLRCANHVDNKYHCHELPVPVQVLICADTKEARRLYIASGNALVRLSSGFRALLPNVIVQLSLNNKSRNMIKSLKMLSWEDDPLSHALSLYEWLSQDHALGTLKDYQFVKLDDIEIQKRLDVISSKYQDKYANIDMMLSPGTYWDAHRWRIQFTVKRLEASKVYHSRIIDTLRSLLRGTNKSDGLWTKKSGQQVVYGLDNSDATLQPIRQFLKLVAGLGAALNPLSYRQRFS
uniref:Uncharacterized protein n=3 Tax=Babesia bovis TaxID=5865 RepID=A7APX5_BABBO|eukprot:XP_001612177.1 hypothetical protein [Babesia bovis T2Bo]